MKDVGPLLIAALRTPTSTPERILKVNSFTGTAKEALTGFEKQTGAKWNVTYSSPVVLKQLEQEAWANDSSLKTVLTLRVIWYEGGTLYDKRDNGSIGFEGQEEGLQEQVRKMIELHG